MQTCYATTKQRLESSARLLAQIGIQREIQGEPDIGRGVEAFVIGRELRELEHLALSDGATWD